VTEPFAARGDASLNPAVRLALPSPEIPGNRRFSGV